MGESSAIVGDWLRRNACGERCWQPWHVRVDGRHRSTERASRILANHHVLPEGDHQGDALGLGVRRNASARHDTVQVGAIEDRDAVCLGKDKPTVRRQSFALQSLIGDECWTTDAVRQVDDRAYDWVANTATTFVVRVEVHLVT